MAVAEPEYELVRPLGDNLFELYATGWSYDDGTRVLVQAGRSGGRMVITGLVVLGPAVGTATLRAVPVARIESILNHPDNAEHLKPSRAQPLSSALGSLLRRTALGVEQQPYKPPRERLSRPDGTDPETFYRLVADAYNEAIMKTPKPALDLAAEAEVPVPTVHRWIAEARRRGFLPPARQGRAG